MNNVIQFSDYAHRIKNPVKSNVLTFEEVRRLVQAMESVDLIEDPNDYEDYDSIVDEDDDYYDLED
jgi:hypothetical protein